MRALNFTKVIADTNGVVRVAVANVDNVTFKVCSGASFHVKKVAITIGRYNPDKYPVHFANGYSYTYVMDVMDTISGMSIHNTGVCGIGTILSYLFTLELSMLGIKPMDVSAYLGDEDEYVEAKILYANPEGSHVQVT